MDTNFVKHKARHTGDRLLKLLLMVVLSLICGLVLGALGGAFSLALKEVLNFRLENSWLTWFLPVGAVVILLLYHALHDDKDQGTNLVLLSIQTDENVPFRVSGLIFVSTLLSQLVGASVGREGAALQLGGSVGNFLGRKLHLSKNGIKVLTMVGMSAVFSALLGTPMAAAFFPLEVVSVGIMHYGALMPCVISSFVGRSVAAWMGCDAMSFTVGENVTFEWVSALKISGLAILCGLLSILFCLALRYGEVFGKKWLKNRYIRAAVLGTVVLGLTLLVGDQTYNGAGVNYITQCMAGDEKVFGFLIKIVFTVLSIVAGYKGGEIIPSLFIGASFGCLYGDILGWEPALCAAIGMGTVFCGVTNCPVSALLICVEMFGLGQAWFFLLACAVAYMFSGYYGLYTSQRIVYSKYRQNYIDKKAL